MALLKTFPNKFYLAHFYGPICSRIRIALKYGIRIQNISFFIHNAGMALYYSIPDLRRSRSSRFGSHLWTSKISDDKISNIMLFWYGIHKQCSEPGIQRFLTTESGMKKKSGSEFRNKHLGSYCISGSLELIFWVQKINIHKQGRT